MADGDDSVLTDDQEESFLTETSSISGVDFDLASGINAGNVARAIIGSFVFTVALGVNTVVGGLTAAYTGLVDGVREFLTVGSQEVEFGSTGWEISEAPGLVDVVFGTGIAAIRGAWSFSLDEFGVFAYPVAMAVIVASFYVIGRGFDRVRGELT
ncbi:hypothetical protein [Halorubrum sp. F4]|uniref:hypothetical protein n=1 Tax=Halorubrum sp. F4 TaxID=2989715 RepID=UPI002481145D|nr:hypothetical protein [Halorubrum sp. F4]